MPLPINIHELLRGKAVEWERLEFKEGKKRWSMPFTTAAKMFGSRWKSASCMTSWWS
jgi:hypothetical protein